MPRATKAPATVGAPSRLRSDTLFAQLLPGYRARLKALATAEGDTVSEWLERQVERCEVEAEMRGTVGKRRAKIDP